MNRYLAALYKMTWYASFLFPALVTAQGSLNFDAIDIDTVQLEDNVHVLMGGPAQGNLLVLSGPDGIFMVDSMYAPMHDKLLAAIREISDAPLKYLVNTQPYCG